ncbi:hypothetical protein S7711_01155 [Stachybotrys chartarum IBT 7711]|uniref:DUF7514 domain-containing protein n=1 Tax=Stachybotrys chartarum (strain CBS 109288 / IBT 7711) TaxID=1280523 RepID=A0A084ASU9_STACB|nr:hypothetical protein S7711_01155 [Stachybotrys chartarum IBT 7711]KFA48949.1 hypothetical protein S40293_02533 [Stachybotrys chartarum IBT 40293]
MATASAETKPSKAPTIQYAYMFEKNKSPTVQLDSILRAIALYIIKEIGDKRDANLTPNKLAAFYKAVGGNYDSLFVNNPHQAISYIWRVTGCQHSLQPGNSDFEAPSIPALTLRGFSRWESLQILLDPEEHVPFIQFAVKNWNLKHPETGQIFPPDLPKNVFPEVTDSEVDLWHQSCAKKLRDEAGPSLDPTSQGRGPGAVPEVVPDHDTPKFAYVHIRNPWQKPTNPPDHQGRGRAFAYNHVPAGRYTGRKGSEQSSDRDHRDPSPREPGRRRSFSDYPSPVQPDSPPRHAYVKPHIDHSPNRPSQGRRHSHPRHASSDESDDEPPPHRSKRSQHHSPPPLPSIRRFVPPSASQPPLPSASNLPSIRAHRSDIRADEHRKRNVPSPRGLRNKLSETVSSILPNGLSDRPRNGSRNSSYDDSVRPRRGRDPVQPSRLSHPYSDEDSKSSLDDDSSEDDMARRRRVRDEQRDRAAHRDRGRQYRDVEDDRENRRVPPLSQRPELHRRTSSHADVDRRRDLPTWDAYDRDRAREERRKWDRRAQGERGPSPVSTSRRYPEPAYG